MTSDNNRTGDAHGQDAVPASSTNDPYSRGNPLIGEGQSAVPGGPLSDAYDAEPTVPPVAGTSSGRDGSDGSSTSSAAKHEAREVGTEGKEAGKKVAGTAKEEAANVAGEARDKAKDLVAELGDDLRSQASTQQQRVAEGLRSISDELGSMANNSQEQGMATHLVQQAASRTDSAANWLGDREPGSLLDDVKSFARKRPGTFLAIAAGAGILAGRLTRGVSADADAMEREKHNQHRSTGEHVDRRISQDRVGSYEAGAPRDQTMPGAPVPPMTGPATPGGPIPPSGGPVPLAGGSVPPENGPVPPIDDPRREDYL